MTLTEALEQVELEPGKSYRCRVKKLWVELRVCPASSELAARFDESDVMLDPWNEFPEPEPRGTLAARRSDPEPPDVPTIPSCEDGT